jgi:hypothetical protein
VNDRIFVRSEPYEPDLTRSFGLFRRLQRLARRKGTVRILQPDILVKLHRVDMVRLQPPQRLVDLSRRRFLGATVELRHQEDLFPVSVPERLAQDHFALSAVVVPAVIYERNPVVDRGAHDADTIVLVGGRAYVGAFQPDGRNLDTRLAECAIDHVSSLIVRC